MDTDPLEILSLYQYDEGRNPSVVSFQSVQTAGRLLDKLELSAEDEQLLQLALKEERDKVEEEEREKAKAEAKAEADAKAKVEARRQKELEKEQNPLVCEPASEFPSLKNRSFVTPRKVLTVSVADPLGQGDKGLCASAEQHLPSRSRFSYFVEEVDSEDENNDADDNQFVSPQPRKPSIGTHRKNRTVRAEIYGAFNVGVTPIQRSNTTGTVTSPASRSTSRKVVNFEKYRLDTSKSLSKSSSYKRAKLYENESSNSSSTEFGQNSLNFKSQQSLSAGSDGSIDQVSVKRNNSSATTKVTSNGSKESTTASPLHVFNTENSSYRSQGIDGLSNSSRDTPIKDTPTKDTTTKDTPTKDTTTKDTPTKDSTTKDTPTKDTTTKDTPTKDSTTKDTPTKDTPAKDTSTQDTPTKDTPTKNKWSRRGTKKKTSFHFKNLFRSPKTSKGKDSLYSRESTDDIIGMSNINSPSTSTATSVGTSTTNTPPKGTPKINNKSSSSFRRFVFPINPAIPLGDISSSTPSLSQQQDSQIHNRNVLHFRSLSDHHAVNNLRSTPGQINLTQASRSQLSGRRLSLDSRHNTGPISHFDTPSKNNINVDNNEFFDNAAGSANNYSSPSHRKRNNIANLGESARKLHDACSEGNMEACFLYGMALRHGYGVIPDPEESFHYLFKATGLKSEVHDIFQIEINPFLLENSRSVPDIAPEPSAPAIYECAISYLKGFGMDHEDEVKGLKFLEKAASIGHLDAMCLSGMIWSKKSSVRRKDLPRAAAWFRMAEKRGAHLIGAEWIYKDKYIQAARHG